MKHVVCHDATRGLDAYAVECLRCGEKQRFVVPIRVDVYVAAVKAFERSHRGCKARESANRNPGPAVG